MFAPGADEERIMDVALESGADDVATNDDNSIDVTTTLENFQTVKDAMVSAKLEPAWQKSLWLPQPKSHLTKIKLKK